MKMTPSSQDTKILETSLLWLVAIDLRLQAPQRDLYTHFSKTREISGLAAYVSNHEVPHHRKRLSGYDAKAPVIFYPIVGMTPLVEN